MTRKLNYSKMTNVSNGKFEIDGVQYRKAIDKEYHGKTSGTSQWGLWLIVTDDVNFHLVYKADVLKVDVKNAVALFN